MVKQAKKKIDDSALPSAVCSFCRNLVSFNDRSCKAFSHIPDKIWNGSNDHTSAVDGDGGVIFESVADDAGK